MSAQPPHTDATPKLIDINPKPISKQLLSGVSEGVKYFWIDRRDINEGGSSNDLDSLIRNIKLKYGEDIYDLSKEDDEMFSDTSGLGVIVVYGAEKILGLDYINTYKIPIDFHEE